MMSQSYDALGSFREATSERLRGTRPSSRRGAAPRRSDCKRQGGASGGGEGKAGEGSADRGNEETTTNRPCNLQKWQTVPITNQRGGLTFDTVSDPVLRSGEVNC